VNSLFLGSVGILGSLFGSESKSDVAAVTDEVTKLRFMVESMEQQLIALYGHQAVNGTSTTLSAEAVKSLEDQLISLYAERQAQSGSNSNLHDMLASMESQLVSLYAERNQVQGNAGLSSEIILSLEDQVRSYIDERQESEKELLDLRQERLKVQQTLRSIAKMSIEFC